MTRKLLFVSSSRADFGKILTLIRSAHAAGHECHVLATGMHYRADLGSTYLRVEQQCSEEGWRYIPAPLNYHNSLGGKAAETGQRILPFLEAGGYDLVVVHGDRAEALGAAQHAALANYRVAHVEGGEVTGTADESMRHCISKLAHLHLVANERARRRLIQLGERQDSIYVIGSPDLDLALSDELPSPAEIAERYDVEPIKRGEAYGVLVYHPVTTLSGKEQAKLAGLVARSVASLERPFVMLGCNDDPGSDIVTTAMLPLRSRAVIRYLPSMRFEHFLGLLRGASVMVGNSSAGIREAPVYGVATVNVGTRQNGRDEGVESVLTVPGANTEEVSAAIRTQWGRHFEPNMEFGEGDSGARFAQVIKGRECWSLPIQKAFVTLQGGGSAPPSRNEMARMLGQRGGLAKAAARQKQRRRVA